MSRPRPSVLAQFDPLLSEAEPDYVSDSEDESDPNKENLVPELNDLSMTAFFSRTYKREYAQPAALTKRLVDIGDVTIADTVEEEEEEEEEEGEEEGEGVKDENVFFSLETPKRSDAPRTPLAEISLEHKSRHTLNKKLVESRTQPGDAMSLLTSLVDSVNLAGKSFGHIQRRTLPPRIMVDNSDDDANDILATPAPFNLRTSTSSLQDTSEASQVSLLAPPSSVTPHISKDSNRLSLDLHSSFNLQLQSETSFDLLNDRISFFDGQGKGMSSFLNALDDESDTESCQAITPKTSPSTSCNDDDTTPTQETKVMRNTETVIQDRSSSALPLTGSKELSPSLSSVASPQTSSLVFEPLIKQPNPMVTPAMQRIVVPSVPALRVIKRTKRYDDDRASSTASSTSSGSSTVNNSTRAKILSPPPPPLAVAASDIPIPRPPLKFPLRHEESTRAVVAENSVHTTAKAMTKPLLLKVGAVSGSSGPRRILLPESTKPSKPVSGPNAFARPKVPTPTLGAMNAKGPFAAKSGVPRPVGASGLPPPASKLPAPSGIARFGRKVSAPAATESSSRIAPVRIVPRRYPTYGP